MWWCLRRRQGDFSREGDLGQPCLFSGVIAMNESVFSVVTDATLTRFAADANWSSFRTLRCSLWRRAHGSVRSEDRDPETDAAWRPREVAALPPDSPNFLLAEVRRVAFAPAEVAAQMDRCGIGEKLGAQLDAFVYGLSECASER